MTDTPIPPPTGNDAAATASPEQTIAKLTAELEQARAEAANYLDQWRRTAADFSNYRKRADRDQADRERNANAQLLRRLLPVADDLERAFQTMPNGLRSLTWVEGVFLIYNKLMMILEAAGVKPIETAGKMFDPQYHDAVTHEAVEGFSEGQIIGEAQRGYMLGEMVLRPALVRVAKQPEAAAPPPPPEAPQPPAN